MKKVSGETAQVGLPNGTKRRIAKVRGDLRQTEWIRRQVLLALDQAEQDQARSAASQRASPDEVSGTRGT